MPPTPHRTIHHIILPPSFLSGPHFIFPFFFRYPCLVSSGPRSGEALPQQRRRLEKEKMFSPGENKSLQAMLGYLINCSRPKSQFASNPTCGGVSPPCPTPPLSPIPIIPVSSGSSIPSPPSSLPLSHYPSAIVSVSVPPDIVSTTRVWLHCPGLPQHRTGISSKFSSAISSPPRQSQTQFRDSASAQVLRQGIQEYYVAETVSDLGFAGHRVRR